MHTEPTPSNNTLKTRINYTSTKPNVSKTKNKSDIKHDNNDQKTIASCIMFINFLLPFEVSFSTTQRRCLCLHWCSESTLRSWSSTGVPEIDIQGKGKTPWILNMGEKVIDWFSDWLIYFHWCWRKKSYRGKKRFCIYLVVFGWNSDPLFDEKPVKWSRNTKSKAIYTLFSHN